MDAEFQVPEPDEIIPLTMGDGAKITFRRHGNPNGRRIILSHGNGFASDAYFPFWRYLLPEYDVILYDQRNHGWNPRHDLIIHHDVPWFSSDLEELLNKIKRNCGEKPTFGVFIPYPRSPQFVMHLNLVGSGKGCSYSTPHLLCRRRTTFMGFLKILSLGLRIGLQNGRQSLGHPLSSQSS